MTQDCEGIDCQNSAKFQCPTCIKQKLSPSYFCDQVCFKKNWATHKLKHNQVVSDPFPNHSYTGSLRPLYPLSKKRVVPDHIVKPDYAVDGIPRSEDAVKGSTDIKVLNASEIQKMRVVCKIARDALNAAASIVKVGVTTDEIDKVVHDYIISKNAYPSPLNYHGFPKSCCTSVNEVICHGIPDMRPLCDGDIVNIDVTAYFDGFHGDVNATYLVGDVDNDSKKLVESARECLKKAIEAVKPGMRYRDLGDIIQGVAKSHGHQVVKNYCGHGINDLFHCAPNVPHYAKNKAIGIMKPGHTFTIEPMINRGTYNLTHWPDNWTAVTADGKRSAQFEETLLVTETGVEILT